MTRKGQQVRKMCIRRDRGNNMRLAALPILLSTFAVIAISVEVQAQDTEPELARIELFAGYAYLRADSENGRANLNGWTLSVEGNLNRSLALVADFDGTYRRDQN